MRGPGLPAARAGGEEVGGVPGRDGGGGVTNSDSDGSFECEQGRRMAGCLNDDWDGGGGHSCTLVARWVHSPNGDLPTRDQRHRWIARRRKRLPRATTSSGAMERAWTTRWASCRGHTRVLRHSYMPTLRLGRLYVVRKNGELAATFAILGEGAPRFSGVRWAEPARGPRICTGSRWWRRSGSGAREMVHGAG